MRFRGFVSAAVLLTVAAACGGKDEAKPPSSTREKYVPVVPTKVSEGTGPCGLLSQAEIAAAVGQPFNAGEGISSEGAGSCSWHLRGSATQLVNVVTLSPGGDPYQQTLSTAAKPIEPISGVGERAFIATDTVWAFKGPRVVAVQVVTSQPLNSRKQFATKLAQTAIERA
ncbi:MAG: DUF3558 family protein [Acidimicrobiales bacterium]